MQAKQLFILALLALGAFYVFADESAQKQYLPEFLSKLTRKQRQILGAIILVAGVYMYYDDKEGQKGIESDVPFYARGSVGDAGPQESSELLQMNIPRRRSSFGRGSRRGSQGSPSTISLPSYSTLPSSSLSSLPTSSSD
jgi:hypothetical protein